MNNSWDMISLMYLIHCVSRIRPERVIIGYGMSYNVKTKISDTSVLGVPLHRLNRTAPELLGVPQRLTQVT